MERDIVLESIFKKSGSALFVIDVSEDGDFHCRGLNPSHERLRSMRSDESARAERDRYMRCLMDGKGIEYEEHIQWKGRETWYLTRLSPVKNDAGRIFLIIGISTNITKLKKKEEELQKTNFLNSNLLAASPVGVITYDETGQCTSANKSSAKILGATREQLLKQNYHTNASWGKSGLHDRAIKAAKTGKTTEKEVHLTTTFNKEVWVFCRFIPFKMNQFVQLLLLVEDVSERKKADLALKEAYRQVNQKVREQTLELKKANRGLLKEVRSRKQSEEKTRQINSILRAKSKINRLTINTTDKKMLISQACRILVRSRGMNHAWIGLMNGSSLPDYMTHFGIGKAWEEFRKIAADGKLPFCIREVIKTKKARIITNPETSCIGCPLSYNNTDQGSMIIPLKYEENIYGVLCISVSTQYLSSPEETELLQEVGEDLAFSLSKIAAEEKLKQYHGQFLALFDGIEDTMYVSDPDSYELIYVNPKFKENWGSDLIGEKCYRVIHNHEKPCDFCTNDKIFGKHKGKTHVWEYWNEVTGQWYRCTDKAIRWSDGRWVRFEIASDISKQQFARETIEKQAYNLKERLKEMGCINKVLEIRNKPDHSQDEVLTKAAQVIPSGWQYPEITCSRITFNGKEYVSAGFKESPWKQEATIDVPGNPGKLEVFYSVEKPTAEEGPFLSEERNLIHNLGRILENYILKQQVNEELELKNKEYYSLYEEYQAQNEALETANEELSGEIVKRRLNEEKLRESEGKYRTLVENIPQKIFLKDKNYRFVSINENFARDLNIKPEEAVGKVDSDFFPKVLADKYHTDDKRIMKTGRTEDLEERYIQDGEYFWVHTIKTPVRDEHGDIIGILGIFRDITEQKRNEEKLRLSLDELKIRNQVAEVLLTVLDEAMFDEVLKIVLEIMESDFGVFGYMDELGDLIVPTMTRHIWDKCMVPDKNIRFPRTSWENSDSTWPMAMREQRPVYSNEPSTKVPTGHVPISRNLSVPIVNKGKSIGLLQVANKNIDYTELDVQLLVTIAEAIAPVLDARLQAERQEKIRVEAEKALRESESRYRTLVENIPQKIFLKDKNYRWVSINENFARDLKIKPEEAMGKVDSDFFPKELADKYRADDKRIMKTGKAKELEEQYIQDGEYFWVQTIKTPVRNERGDVIGVLGIFWDITEQRRIQIEKERLNAELLEKNYELGQIVYVTSHELRSPLVNIQGFSRELEEDITELGDILSKKNINSQSRERLAIITGEEIPEALTYINASIMKMDGLLKGLLMLSRIGRVELEMENIHMKSLLEEISSILDYKIKNKGIELNFGDLPDCTGDKNQINQVFTNLIENAVKYMDPEKKGIIKVSGWTENDRNIYCVEDNGIGIEQEHLKNIFKLFHKLQSSSEGEGLGLAIVKKIIERHNGQLWVESETGKGSKFYLSLLTKQYGNNEK
jgi:PAS domain S-box-containing protein